MFVVFEVGLNMEKGLIESENEQSGLESVDRSWVLACS